MANRNLKRTAVDFSEPAAKRVKTDNILSNRQVVRSDCDSEYSDDILGELRDKQKSRKEFHFQSPQGHWRGTFVRFIEDFCQTFEFSRQTLHLAIYILDMFMDNYSIEYHRLHLVTLNSVWLASKVEETCIPKVSHLNGTLVYTYPTKDYLNLEKIMIDFFQWNLLVPTAATFFGYYIKEAIDDDDIDKLSKASSSDGLKPGKDDVLNLAVQYLDATLTDLHLLYTESPSKLAAACIAAARHTSKLRFWSEQLHKITLFTSKDIETCMLNVLSLNVSPKLAAPPVALQNNEPSQYTQVSNNTENPSAIGVSENDKAQSRQEPNAKDLNNIVHSAPMSSADIINYGLSILDNFEEAIPNDDNILNNFEYIYNNYPPHTPPPYIHEVFWSSNNASGVSNVVYNVDLSAAPDIGAEELINGQILHKITNDEFESVNRVGNSCALTPQSNDSS